MKVIIRKAVLVEYAQRIITLIDEEKAATNGTHSQLEDQRQYLARFVNAAPVIEDIVELNADDLRLFGFPSGGAR